MRSEAKQSRTRRECAAKMAFDPTTKFLLLTDNEIARQSTDHPKPLEQTDPKGNPNGRNRPAKSNTIRPLGYQPCRAGYSAGLPQRVLRSAAPPDLCAVHSVAALLSLSRRCAAQEPCAAALRQRSRVHPRQCGALYRVECARGAAVRDSRSSPRA